MVRLRGFALVTNCVYRADLRGVLAIVLDGREEWFLTNLGGKSQEPLLRVGIFGKTLGQLRPSFYDYIRSLMGDSSGLGTGPEPVFGMKGLTP